VQAGQDLPDEIIEVSNTGEGVLHFAVSDNVTSAERVLADLSASAGG